MIIYNKTWLDNLQLLRIVEQEKDAGSITPDEYKIIKEKYPVDFYKPAIFIRIGLFVLTFIVVLFSAGLLSLFLLKAEALDSFGCPLFLGIILYVVLEVMVKSKNYYASGIDDALLLMAAGLTIGAFIWFIGDLNITNTAVSYTIEAIFICLICSYFTLRFASTLMSALACLSAMAAIYFGWQCIGNFGMATLPFIIMAISAILYLTARNTINKPGALYYSDCLITVQLVSLLTLYLAGNYYVVSELSDQLKEVTYGVAKPVPFGFFFWIWTIAVPLVYTILGIKKKNELLLRVGILLIAASVLTFRNYYHVLSVEAALTLGGAILLAAMYAIVKYLKTPKHGFTYAEIKSGNTIDKLKIESLITAGTFSHASGTPSKPVERFGGGSFGGGGATDSF